MGETLSGSDAGELRPQRCDDCGHVFARHGTWWTDKDSRPCHVKSCPCTDYMRYCRHTRTTGLAPDDSVYCFDCGWTFCADG